MMRPAIGTPRDHFICAPTSRTSWKLDAPLSIGAARSASGVASVSLNPACLYFDIASEYVGRVDNLYGLRCGTHSWTRRPRHYQDLNGGARVIACERTDLGGPRHRNVWQQLLQT